uniref:Uncharacterized protein n=1 Tax=Trichinella nativa TaxID=6335 RepID=A0A0V1KJC6_9BILA
MGDFWDSIGNPEPGKNQEVTTKERIKNMAH